MDSMEEKIAAAELYTNFLRGIKVIDDYIKETYPNFNHLTTNIDLYHSVLLWKELSEINQDISQKRKIFIKLVDDGNDMIKKRHPESANIQECIALKENDFKNLERSCEEQMQQLEISVLNCLKEKHSNSKLEHQIGDAQVFTTAIDIQASEFIIKFKDRIWEHYQPFVLLEIERMISQPLHLHTAILNGDYDEVVHLCEKQQDFEGRSVLHVAILCTVTHKEADVATNIFYFLLNSGLDPWEKDDLMGWNCFEYAAKIKAYPILDSLLSKIGEERSSLKLNFEELLPASFAGDYVNIMKYCSLNTIDRNVVEYIWEICERGSINVLKYMIDNFENILDHLKQVDEFQNTLLHKTCTGQHFKILELLLGCGLHVDAVNVIGKTALHIAAEVRAIKCIEVLLKYGSNVLVKDVHERTPLYMGRCHDDVLDLLTVASNNSSYNQLHLATYSGNVEYVRNLIEAGNDVNFLNNRNENVLHIAAETGNDEMMELLAGKMADLNFYSNKGLTALHVALLKAHVKCAEILISKGADIECKNKMQNTPLHLAAKHGYESVLKMLLTKGAKTYCFNNNVQTALHLACQHSNFVCIENLLQEGAHIDSRDEGGNYPLHLAATNGDVAILNLLCKKGADINKVNLKHQTAMHIASEHGNLAWVQGLLKRQMDVNVRDEDLNTPLILAAKSSHLDVLKFLIKKQASINAANKKYQTAMYFACENGDLECVKLLESKGFKQNLLEWCISPLYVAAANGHKEVVSFLISKAWKINKLDNERKTILQLTACVSHVQCAQILIDNGADVDGTGFDRLLKPFHLATICGKCDIMELLLHHGVDVNCSDKYNLTALHFAAMISNSYQAVEFLIKHDANINSQDVMGCTPLHVAFLHENKEVITILKQHGARTDIRNTRGYRPSDMTRATNNPIFSHYIFHLQHFAHQFLMDLL